MRWAPIDTKLRYTTGEKYKNVGKLLSALTLPLRQEIRVGLPQVTEDYADEINKLNLWEILRVGFYLRKSKKNGI